MTQTWLTTADNPFNPFDDHDNWRRFDEQHGYFTTNFIARVCRSSDEMSEELQNQAWNDAIEDILKYANTNNYQKVTREIG